ncbi:MAG: hypothetical protein NWR43_01010 [Alphaproteobacteria bacterium]|nr:hypothetical protein [Alphaproteobacteria bacterium]
MKKLSLIGVLAVLSGCSNYAETFDCGAGMGVGCKSLSYVNRMVEKGVLPLDEDGLSDIGTYKDQSTTPLPLGFKMWVAGYRDEEGYYHDPSFIHLGGNQ